MSKQTSTDPSIAQSQPPRDPSANHFAGLDGLRAVAVLAVLAFHLTPGAAVGGYLGVDIFFVISGFLITGLLLHERASAGRTRFRVFWLRRVRRLFPAIVVLLLVCCSVALLIGGDVLLGLGRQVLGAVTFSSNWLYIADGSSYFDAAAPDLFRNLWSLAVEEQFYLAWPFVVLLVILIRRRWLRATALLAVAVASALAMALLYTPEADATRVYYGTDTHSFGLAIGAALAVLARDWDTARLWRRRAYRVALPTIGFLALGALLALVVIMPTDSPLTYRGGLAVVAVLTAIAIAGSITTGSWLGRVLDLPPLRWVGLRSYGLYLWHWPVSVLLGAAFSTAYNTPAGAWVMGGVAAAITFGAAYLSYRFVEEPIRVSGFRATAARWLGAWRRGRRPLAAAVASIALVTGAGVLTGVAIASDPGQSELQMAIEAGQQAIDDAKVPAHAPTRLPGGNQITAIGDSVMLAAAPTVQADFPGILIDAVVSRQMRDAPAALQAIIDAGDLRPILVIGLGTNGSIGADTLETIQSMVDSKTEIVVVNVQAPRDWVPDVNTILARFAQQNRLVDLANWHDAIQPRLDVLSADDIHPGGPEGGEIYAGCLRDAIQRLAELPPLLQNNQYVTIDRPV